MEEVKVYHVHKKAKEQIPDTIKVHKYDFILTDKEWGTYKWSKDYVVYKLESISKSEYPDYLKVTYKKL